MSETNTSTAEVKSETTIKPKSEWAARERGCLWMGENGRMTIHIKAKDGNIVKFIAFPNKFKEEGSRQPDYRIYSDKENNNATPVASKSTKSPEKKSTKPIEKTPEPVEEDDNF